jgi:hypothetical protein
LLAFSAVVDGLVDSAVVNLNFLALRFKGQQEPIELTIHASVFDIRVVFETAFYKRVLLAFQIRVKEVPVFAKPALIISSFIHFAILSGTEGTQVFHVEVIVFLAFITNEFLSVDVRF